MRSYHVVRSRLCDILAVGLLVLSALSLWGQATQFIPAPGHLLISPEATKNQTVLGAGFYAPRTHYDQPLNNRAFFKLQPLTGNLALLSHARNITENAPGEWWTLSFCNAQHPATRHANFMYGSGETIPWARPIILRVSQQAKAHPRVTSVLKILKPTL